MDGNSVAIAATLEGQIYSSIQASSYADRNLDFSRDGAYLITGNVDGSVQLKNAATAEHFGTPTEKGAGIRSIDADPLCTWVAAADGDGISRVWHIETGECAQVMLQMGP